MQPRSTLAIMSTPSIDLDIIVVDSAASNVAQAAALATVQDIAASCEHALAAAIVASTSTGIVASAAATTRPHPLAGPTLSGVATSAPNGTVARTATAAAARPYPPVGMLPFSIASVSALACSFFDPSMGGAPYGSA
jgi:ABC-type Fe3+-siderophore transport system permease subunit